MCCVAQTGHAGDSLALTAQGSNICVAQLVCQPPLTQKPYPKCPVPGILDDELHSWQMLNA